mmetsp:Transcript_15268/g.22507  ORF Transcript_15268/g.22507 Transcript_15268/m.22507 type:complete len:220 (-) Transcript_15268:770-1429(-)
MPQQLVIVTILTFLHKEMKINQTSLNIQNRTIIITTFMALGTRMFLHQETKTNRSFPETQKRRMAIMGIIGAMVARIVLHQETKTSQSFQEIQGHTMGMTVMMALVTPTTLILNRETKLKMVSQELTRKITQQSHKMRLNIQTIRKAVTMALVTPITLILHQETKEKMLPQELTRKITHQSSKMRINIQITPSRVRTTATSQGEKMSKIVKTSMMKETH